MMARRWTSFVEVFVNPIDLSQELFDVVEEEFCLAEQLVLEASGTHRRDGNRGAVRGEDVVWSIADGQGVRVVAACPLERGPEDLRRRLGDFHVALRRRCLQKITDADELRIVRDFAGARRR